MTTTTTTRSRIKTFRDDDKKTVIKIGVILNWRPAGLSESTDWGVVVAVILESCSPGSVVIKIRIRYWNAARRTLAGRTKRKIHFIKQKPRGKRNPPG